MNRIQSLTALTAGIVLFHSHVYSLGVVKGSSMSPSLNHNKGSDVVLINKWTREFTYGDVVFIKNPFKPDQTLVKRIVGLSGDHVCKESPNPNEYHANEWNVMEFSPPKKSEWILIPQGYVWVESDAQGLDSKTLGPLPMALITGKVERIVLPWERFGISLQNPYFNAQLESRLRRRNFG